VKKFPLEPLVKLRAHAAHERTESLRDQVGQVQQAHRAVAVAEHNERTHDAARREVELSEQERVLSGAATVADFALLHGYQVGAERVAANLRQQRTLAAQRLGRAEVALSEAEQALAEARAEQKVVDRQQERFVASERARAELAAEEEALEVWGSRRV